MLGLCPDPSASFLHASPGLGSTCSSLLEGYPWATGAILPVGTESRKFTSPLECKDMKTQLPCLRLGNSETNLPSRAPLQDQADATFMGTVPETAPWPGFLPSLPCSPYSFTGVPWEHFLTKLFVGRSLSWGLLFGGTYWRRYFKK